MQLGDRLPTITLATADGEVTTLEQYFDRPRIIALPRYYG